MIVWLLATIYRAFIHRYSELTCLIACQYIPWTLWCSGTRYETVRYISVLGTVCLLYFLSSRLVYCFKYQQNQ